MHCARRAVHRRAAAHHRGHVERAAAARARAAGRAHAVDRAGRAGRAALAPRALLVDAPGAGERRHAPAQGGLAQLPVRHRAARRLRGALVLVVPGPRRRFGPAGRDGRSRGHRHAPSLLAGVHDPARADAHGVRLRLGVEPRGLVVQRHLRRLPVRRGRHVEYCGHGPDHDPSHAARPAARRHAATTCTTWAVCCSDSRSSGGTSPSRSTCCSGTPTSPARSSGSSSGRWARWPACSRCSASDTSSCRSWP